MRSLSNVPFYLNYFPHAIGLNSQNRKVYNFHIISNHFQFLSLDSYVIEPIDGIDQINWMKNIFEKNQFRKSIVGYHASLYPR